MANDNGGFDIIADTGTGTGHACTGRGAIMTATGSTIGTRSRQVVR